MVYAGTEGSDMTIASVVLGLLSPVLSFTHTAQSFGLNAGTSFYVMGSSSKPSSTSSSDGSIKP
jgi:hypothetical protein